MQTPTDYRDFFNFTLVQPMGITDASQVEEVIEYLYDIGAIPLTIIDDINHPLIEFNRRMVQKDIKIIIIAVSYAHNPYLS